MNELERLLEESSLHRRFAVDILSVARGVRRLGLIHAPREAESSLRRAFAQSDLRVLAQRFLFRSDDPDSREGILRDCEDGETANFVELWYARPEASSLPQPEELFANAGRHLGYPRCCVAEWERLQSQRELYQRYLFDTVSGHWEINRLATLFQNGLLIPDFYPCSLSCDDARAFALPILGIAREALDPSWVRETVRWMQAPLVQFSETLYAFPSWTLTGSTLELLLLDARKGRWRPWDASIGDPYRSLDWWRSAICPPWRKPFSSVRRGRGRRYRWPANGGSMVARLWRKLRGWWGRWFREPDDPPDQMYPLW